MKKPPCLQKLTRVFTATDITAFFNQFWGKMAGPPSNALRSIKLLPELTPPTWHIDYVAVYPEKVVFCTLTVVQLAREDGTPYLNLPTTLELPEGLPTPQAEDAAMARAAKKK